MSWKYVEESSSFEAQPWQFSVQTKEKNKNPPKPLFPDLGLNPLFPEYEAEGPYIWGRYSVIDDYGTWFYYPSETTVNIGLFRIGQWRR